MVKKGWLSAEDRAKVQYPSVLKPGEGNAAQANDRKGPKGYIMDKVEEELAKQGFPEERLAQGGFTVRTTLRRKAQEPQISQVRITRSGRQARRRQLDEVHQAYRSSERQLGFAEMCARLRARPGERLGRQDGGGPAGNRCEK
jgi:membrane peptidoglycan carboxypeptidase